MIFLTLNKMRRRKKRNGFAFFVHLPWLESLYSIEQLWSESSNTDALVLSNDCDVWSLTRKRKLMCDFFNESIEKKKKKKRTNERTDERSIIGIFSFFFCPSSFLVLLLIWLKSPEGFLAKSHNRSFLGQNEQPRSIFHSFVDKIS